MPAAPAFVGMLAGMYLHVGPFAGFVIATLDRRIDEIDAGTWQPPSIENGEPAAAPPTRSVVTAA